MRTHLQDRPVGDATWGKEDQLLNQLYRWLVEYGHPRHRPLRLTGKGRNPLVPRLRRGMDIRHMTLAQYRYFRDVGLAGQLSSSGVNEGFRGRAPLRSRAAADLALCTGMRPEEWSTVLLPELGIGYSPRRRSVTFPVQACAKYGKFREIYVPSGALDAVENFLLLERPEVVASSAKWLARQRHDLFVVDHIDLDAGTLRGVLDGQRRTFTMSAMTPQIRRITVRENDAASSSPASLQLHHQSSFLSVLIFHGQWQCPDLRHRRLSHAVSTPICLTCMSIFAQAHGIRASFRFRNNSASNSAVTISVSRWFAAPSLNVWAVKHVRVWVIEMPYQGLSQLDQLPFRHEVQRQDPFSHIV